MAIGKLLLKLGIDTTNLDKELGKVEKSMSKFGQNMSNLGSTLTQSLTLPIIGVGAAALKSFADMERLELGLTAIMGSSKAAELELQKLRKTAENPGLALPQVVQASSTLQAVGLSADEARETITQFGNATARAGKGAVVFDELIFAFSKIESTGKITQESINQIAERLPGFSTLLQKTFGASTAEGINATGISAADFSKKTVEALATLERAQGGLGNSFDNLTDNITASLAELGKVINTSLNVEGIFVALSDKINYLVQGFKSLNPETQGFIVKAGLLVAALGPAIFIVGKLITTFGALIGTTRLIMTTVKNLSTVITGAFAKILANPAILGVTLAIAAVGAIALYVYDNWKAFSDNFKNIWINIKNSVMQGVTFVLGKLDSLQKALGLDLFDLSGMTKYQEEQRIVAAEFKTIGETVDSLKGKFKSLFMAAPGKGAAEGGTEGKGELVFGDGGAPTGGGTGGVKSVDASNASMSAVNLLPTLDLLPEKLESVSAANERLKQTNEDVANSFTKITPAIKSVEDLLSPLQKSLVMGIEAFANLAESGFKSMKELAAAVRQSIAVIIGDMIKVFVAKALAGLPPTPFMLAIAPAVAALAGSLGKNLIMKIGAPKLAEGGLATGPTMAMVGDNRNARVDPEVIAPLSKLKSMMGDMGIGGTLETRISGNDLIILLNRSQKGLNRVQ